MSGRVRLLVCLGLLLTVARGHALAATPKGPLQLDATGLGGVILYNATTGVGFEATYDTGRADGFGYLSSSWGPGWTLTPARLNNDSLIDAFFYNSRTGAYRWGINNGTGYTFTSGQWSPDWLVYVADFNGDRLHDLLLYNPASGAWFQCVNTGATDFTYTSGTWPTKRQLVPGDFNGDGKTDVLSYDGSTGAFTEYLTATSGNGFATSASGTWDPGWQIFPVTLNHDALTDLFLYNPATGAWFQCLATTTASLFQYYGETWSAGWNIYPADFDGDGLSDLFVYDPTTGVWYQCYTGTSGNGFRSYLSGQWSPRWDIHITDFDNNGRSDVLVYDVATGTYYQCLTQDDGQFRYLKGQWSPDWLIASEVDRVAPPPPPPAPPPPPRLLVPNILCFGDSITFGSGSGSDPPVGYPERLQRLLGTRFTEQAVKVTNAGRGGEYAAFAGARFQRQLASADPAVNLVILLEGINDIATPGLDNPVGIAGSLRRMVREAKVQGAQMILTTLLPAGPPKIDRPELIAPTNDLIRAIAAEEGVLVVDMYAAFLGRESQLLLPDNLHPHDGGYQVMAEVFYEAILANFVR